MPELPEVETYRRYLEATSLHQPIARIDVEDTKLLTTPYDTLSRTLVGNAFTGTHRIGKHLFVTTRSEAVVILHFGMTGDLMYFRYEEERPRFARIVFYFTNGYKLGFLCPRKFERVGLTDNVAAYCQAKGLGADALEISLAEFTQKIRNKKIALKPLLLNQRTLAGIGNWIADEVLFAARIHPETMAHTLSDDDIERLYRAIRRVLQTAIRHEAAYRYFPKSYLIHARAWDASPYADLEAHRRCPRCTTPIEITQVGGRTTYFCPRCQPKR